MSQKPSHALSGFPGFLSVGILSLGILTGCAAPGPDSIAATDHGYQALLDGNFDTALSAFEARLAVAPRDGRAAFLRAIALDRMRRSNAAADAFAAYARAGGRHPELDFEWGMSLLHAGRPADAAEKLTLYHAAQPSSPRAMLALGQAYLAQSQFDAAERLFRSAATDPAARSSALLRLAASQSGRGAAEAARITLDRINEGNRS